MTDWHDILGALTLPAGLLLALLLLIFLILRPFLRWLSSSRPVPKKNKGEAGVDELDQMIAELKKFKLTDKEKMRRLAASDPEKAKTLIRAWLREDQ